MKTVERKLDQFTLVLTGFFRLHTLTAQDRLAKTLRKMMPLTQLIYMSSLLIDDDEAIASILESARRHNIANHLTGVLLVCDGSVVQVLEGSQNAVSEAFSRIQADTRHTGVFKFSEMLVAERDFSAWSMGFQRVGDAELETKLLINGAFKLGADGIPVAMKPGVAKMILKTFADSQLV